jgi:hypothetical protein
MNIQPGDHTSISYQRLVDEVYPRLADVVLRRYHRRADRSIRDVYRMERDFLTLEPENLEFTLEYRHEINAILAEPGLFDSLVRLFVMSALEFTYANNQFIHIDAAEEKRLIDIYRAYLMGMRSILTNETDAEVIRHKLEVLIAAHFKDLSRNLARFSDQPAGDIEESTFFHRVVCREYTPEFQLEILSVDVLDLKSPVLDLGCGKSGRLVGYLNSKGLHAVGVDRLVDDFPSLVEGDWLNYPLEPESWGTVISHMGFSNHFVFQHLYKQGNPEPYARQYMRILASLKVGGSFYYTPGLPFIEALLPKELYRLTRNRVTPGIPQEQEARVLGADGLYTAQVQKINASC